MKAFQESIRKDFFKLMNPENSPCYDTSNKKVIGKFKDEAAGTPIVELVGLRSKMYSYINTDEKGGKTAKGIKKNVIKNDLKHEDHKNVLLRITNNYSTK